MTKIVLKEGYWCNDNVKAYICVCKDNQLVWKNMVCLDYPNVPASSKVDLEIGEFGPASEEIREATGRVILLYFETTIFGWMHL